MPERTKNHPAPLAPAGSVWSTSPPSARSPSALLDLARLLTRTHSTPVCTENFAAGLAAEGQPATQEQLTTAKKGKVPPERHSGLSHSAPGVTPPPCASKHPTRDSRSDNPDKETPPSLAEKPLAVVTQRGLSRRQRNLGMPSYGTVYIGGCEWGVGGGVITQPSSRGRDQKGQRQHPESVTKNKETKNACLVLASSQHLGSGSGKGRHTFTATSVRLHNRYCQSTQHTDPLTPSRPLEPTEKHRRHKNPCILYEPIVFAVMRCTRLLAAGHALPRDPRGTLNERREMPPFYPILITGPLFCLQLGA